MAFYSIAFSRGRCAGAIETLRAHSPWALAQQTAAASVLGVISQDACISLFSVDSINWRGAECVVVVGWRGASERARERFCASCHCLRCGSTTAPALSPSCTTMSHTVFKCLLRLRSCRRDELVAEQTPPVPS